MTTLKCFSLKSNICLLSQAFSCQLCFFLYDHTLFLWHVHLIILCWKVNKNILKYTQNILGNILEQSLDTNSWPPPWDMFWSFACFFRGLGWAILVRPTPLAVWSPVSLLWGHSHGHAHSRSSWWCVSRAPVTVSLADVLICLPLPISYPAVHTH